MRYAIGFAAGFAAACALVYTGIVWVVLQVLGGGR